MGMSRSLGFMRVFPRKVATQKIGQGDAKMEGQASSE